MFYECLSLSLVICDDLILSTLPFLTYSCSSTGPRTGLVHLAFPRKSCSSTGPRTGLVYLTFPCTYLCAYRSLTSLDHFTFPFPCTMGSPFDIVIIINLTLYSDLVVTVKILYSGYCEVRYFSWIIIILPFSCSTLWGYVRGNVVVRLDLRTVLLSCECTFVPCSYPFFSCCYSVAAPRIVYVGSSVALFERPFEARPRDPARRAYCLLRAVPGSHCAPSSQVAPGDQDLAPSTMGPEV